MSLTSMLNSYQPEHKIFQNILRKISPEKDEFETISGHDAFNATKEYITYVPYQLTSTYQASITGTTFDYLARFIIARFVPRNRNEAMTDLKAVGGLSKISEFLKQINQGELDIQLKQKYDESIRKCDQFTCGECSLDDVIPAAVLLGKLEKCFRDASALINLEQTFFGDVDKDKDIMRELASMCEVFQGEFLIPEIITPESDVVYNPNFGIAGNYVGGADGDILIDGVLYDFKTSKSCGYTWQDVTQLIGYYFLNEISVEKGDFYEDLGIRRVAFYRARFGEIEYYDTDIFTEKASLPPQAFSIVNGEVIFNGDNISFIDKTTRDQTIEELLAYFNKPI